MDNPRHFQMAGSYGIRDDYFTIRTFAPSLKRKRSPTAAMLPPSSPRFDLPTRLEDVPQVIFTTAYDEHAVRAFKVDALDYLLKPIEPARLAEAPGVGLKALMRRERRSTDTALISHRAQNL